MDYSIFYYKNISHVRSFKQADKQIMPLVSKFEDFCAALGIPFYVQRDITFHSPVFYRFEAHFTYTKTTYHRFSTALSIFADINGLIFCNEIFFADGKPCYAERG